jgi:hypothetical protein
MAWYWTALLTALSLTACTRDEEPIPSARPSLAPAATRTPAVITEPSPAATTSPAPDEDDEDMGAEDDLDQPWSDFEIDADASDYTGYVPKQVAFVARAMNGTAPFTYTWDFGDGSPPATGESVTHIFTKVGKNDVFVTGKDGEGRTSRVQMILFLLTPEDYARQRNLDPAALPTIVPSPAPAP